MHFSQATGYVAQEGPFKPNILHTLPAISFNATLLLSTQIHPVVVNGQLQASADDVVS